MPTYDFSCPKCKRKETDVRLTLKEFMDGHKCPECGEKMDTVIESIIPFVLNGDGWTSGGRSK